jgi:hypothetical protein
MFLYIYKKIIYYLNLKQIESNDYLYDVRYIILSYIHSDFKYIKFPNNEYEIYFMNKKIKKNKILKKMFENDKLYLTIDYNIKEKEKNLLITYFYSDYFDNLDNYILYISDLTISEFIESVKFGNFLEIDLHTCFYGLYMKIMKEHSYISISRSEDIKMGVLIDSYFIDMFYL